MTLGAGSTRRPRKGGLSQIRIPERQCSLCPSICWVPSNFPPMKHWENHPMWHGGHGRHYQALLHPLSHCTEYRVRNLRDKD